MVQVIGFVFVIALIYAAKAFSIAKQHEDIAQHCETFSWMHARPEDATLAESWTHEQQSELAPSSAVGAMRHAGSFSA